MRRYANGSFSLRRLGDDDQAQTVMFCRADLAQAFISTWYASSSMRVSERDGAPVNVFD